ncbi:hypothetical protein [Spirosoma linguale]|uniref:Uncharacterized protein n=1 Tax=Spirosoma linguale (strain ATCC 33905 / DSM 74 / LMG 10896 / Claus 1) TaxID=504472 RepID=D2QHN3_SPILD|nr:hypothetical protein Slin_3842 [Spirosoma linguale DSM 74]
MIPFTKDENRLVRARFGEQMRLTQHRVDRLITYNRQLGTRLTEMLNESKYQLPRLHTLYKKSNTNPVPGNQA